MNTDFYKSVLKAWSTKLSGPAVTHDQLTTAHALGCRPGKQAVHIAMCLRPEGCTVTQFVAAASSGPAHNKRRELVAKKLIKVSVMGNPYAYVAALTDKGQKAVTAYAEAMKADAEGTAKPKAKAKRKTTRKAKGDAVPTETVTVETAPVDTPAVVEPQA
jgi:hypothetical protein